VEKKRWMEGEKGGKRDVFERQKQGKMGRERERKRGERACSSCEDMRNGVEKLWATDLELLQQILVCYRQPEHSAVSGTGNRRGAR